MPPIPARNHTPMQLVSAHGWRPVTCTLPAAIDAAIRMFREILPSQAVRIEVDGITIATIDDGHHDIVLVETMPRRLRESHVAAGNAGAYPHNGSIRVLMDRENAMQHDDDWTVIMRSATAADLDHYDYVVDVPR